MKEKIKEALREVEDPELGVDIVSLGFIYDIEVDGSKVEIGMTLTTPGCPMSRVLVGRVEDKVKELDGIDEVDVNLVWEPQWTPEKMTEEAKEKLGFESDSG